MTTDLITVAPKQTIGAALTKMKRHHLKRLPVVSKGKLIGELTMKSLIIQFKKVLRWSRILDEHEKKALESTGDSKKSGNK